jgi:multidrug efflux pump subunit AcrA (membrane-fusion protein)
MLALERSRAQRLRAEAENRNAENVLGRFQKLGKTDSIPKNHIEDAEVSRDIAAAKLKEARTNEKLAELVLNNMQLRAPFTGIMSPPFVAVGTFMDHDSRTSKPLAEIVQMDPIWVVAKVPYNVYLERRLAAKSEKETLERAPWTLVLPSGDIYPHTGRLISADYELDRETQTLATWAEFPNPDFLLRPGLKVTVQSRIGNK